MSVLQNNKEQQYMQNGASLHIWTAGYQKTMNLGYWFSSSLSLWQHPSISFFNRSNISRKVDRNGWCEIKQRLVSESLWSFLQNATLFLSHFYSQKHKIMLYLLKQPFPSTNKSLVIVTSFERSFHQLVHLLKSTDSDHKFDRNSDISHVWSSLSPSQSMWIQNCSFLDVIVNCVVHLKKSGEQIIYEKFVSH